jgi:hypothetical protein
MSKKIAGIIALAVVVFSILLNGCAVPSGGCPYCGYPPGALLDGQDVHCQRCLGTYRVYMDGSVAAINRPTQQYQYPTPTNNTDATQRSLNQTGQLFMEGMRR